MNMQQIEKKWQKRWADAGLFEADPKSKRVKKFFITFPYPYLNGAPHVGHSFSAFRVDAYARFKRMQGYNVLFPQGFHATGEPILGAVERLRKSDPTQINSFKAFGASDSDMERFKTDINYVIKFWMSKWTDDMKASGFSIDWRRSFITAIDERYNKFIEWQYNTLKKLGYVKQGTHPVIWCPHCNSPTGDHDRLEGEGESPMDYILLKFKLDEELLGKEIMLPAATLRPETIYGVTNMWVNPDAEYTIANVNGEAWLVSVRAADKLKDQLNDVEILGKIEGGELAGKRCTDPLSNRSIPILPAKFVDPNSATGVVMSVPSHAPYDWMGIKDLIDRNELERYGTSKEELEPIAIIKTEGLGEHPAVDICKKMGIKSPHDDRLDEATSRVYKKEFHQGVLNVGEYAGTKVSEAKDSLMKDFLDKKIAEVMWDCNLVVCRCTTRCHVKILENQWFLTFSDERWKNKARICIKSMNIYPEEARINFLNTVDWLRDKACARKTGLGTKLPWDSEWIVETLSDSTIYMAYYTLAKTINSRKIPASKLTHEVFDYILLGKGSMKAAKKSGLHTSTLKDMKKQFEYFYPVDMRNSGKDLIQNHLTFYIFHHTGLFQKNRWPKAIGVNGFVNVEGEKMSKSRGNFLTLRGLLEQYGADLTRINIIAAVEGLDDADWRAESIKTYRIRIGMLHEIAKKLGKKKREMKKREIDRWLLSAMQGCIKNATENYEKMKFRTALNHAFFETTSSLRWYMRRSGKPNYDVLRLVLSDIAKLIAPVTPHASEELWEILRNKGFISAAKWPEYNKRLADATADALEKLLQKTIEDIKNIKALVKKRTNTEPKSICLFIARRRMFRKKANKKKQLVFFREAAEFISREVGCEVQIMDADKAGKGAQNIHKEKAGKATPDKPGILIG